LIATPAAGLGAWTTTVLPTLALIGASTITPTSLWKGYVSHSLLGSPLEYPTDRVHIEFDAADVDSNGHIFAGRGARIYKSTDGGATWVYKYTLPGTPGQVARVWVAANDYVYASGRGGAASYGLYRSVDGGTNWTNPLVTGQGAVWGIDEDGAGNLCCGLHMFGAGTKVKIWKSTDNGATWVLKHDVDYGSLLQNHVHDLRYHPATGYWYATIGDQVNQRLLRSVDAGETWQVVVTGVYQLLAMAIMGNYVYVGTDRSTGNRIFRFTDPGAPTVTLEEVLLLKNADDVPIFGASELAGEIYMAAYKETRIKRAKLYAFDGAAWRWDRTILEDSPNRGFYGISRHDNAGKLYVSADYGIVALNGIGYTP